MLWRRLQGYLSFFFPFDSWFHISCHVFRSPAVTASALFKSARILDTTLPPTGRINMGKEPRVYWNDNVFRDHGDAITVADHICWFESERRQMSHGDVLMYVGDTKAKLCKVWHVHRKKRAANRHEHLSIMNFRGYTT